ncbi:uncharacterized protein LOC114337688 [Diabrotica virgifera virgifera]|uniref:Uncharacterized protein LOC114337688 n=1 Tax=Diabrotica virgifera virgifera TaxID=50390 RepID=A0A6P7GB37_DIAVI|nr:uncharacterized protein LOC114337688 [Diabrotica virgifera virgifera]
MLFVILTLLVYVSYGEIFFNTDDNSTIQNYDNEQPYNIYKWVQQLQLQTCAFVGIGLKYYALFVENIEYKQNNTIKSTNYFLGICHYSTLETWNLCSNSLAKKRRNKCTFKLKPGVYQSRVHRRFCDFKVMVKNKDCSCVSSILQENLFKVRGFPMCYIPSLPYSICKYNVCGLSKCSSLTVENSVHSVRCDVACMTGNPFCEGPMHRSSAPPKMNSHWSKWSHQEIAVADGSESQPSRTSSEASSSKKFSSVATCINKYRNLKGLDCLGPGTGCCPPNSSNCICETVEKQGGLVLKRSYELQKTGRINTPLKIKQHQKRSSRKYIRSLRDTNNNMDDDEEEEDDLDEDIVLEEDTTETTPSTTEYLEKEELDEQVSNDLEDRIIQLRQNITSSKSHSSKFKCISEKILRWLLFILVVVFL